MGEVAPSLPVPAGGMTLERVPEMVEFYGEDVILLIGGALHRRADLASACREFRSRVGTSAVSLRDCSVPSNARKIRSLVERLG